MKKMETQQTGLTTFFQIVNGENGWKFDLTSGADGDVILRIGQQLLGYLENDFKSTVNSYNYDDYDDYDDED